MSKIYTITLNPAVDLITETDSELESDLLIRLDKTNLYPGGKGINASIVLQRFGYPNECISFVDSKIGSIITNYFQKHNYESSFDNAEHTRINIKINANNKDYQLNDKGYCFSNNNFDFLEKKIEEFKKDDLILIMGSLPKMEISHFLQLVKKIFEKTKFVVLDIPGKILLDLLKFKPFLIKPNLEELNFLLDAKYKYKSEIERGIVKLKKMGAQNVIVSLGKDGSILNYEEKYFYHRSDPVEKPFPNGAGDSMISIFAASILIGKLSPSKAFEKANKVALLTVENK